MREERVAAGACSLPVYSLNTVVVGTGAAGYNAADRLYAYGQHDIAMVTEHVLAGTSRNSGSDKQTYYKLTLSGDTPDSVWEMAETLFSGQCVDGDLALCEASLSTQCFLKLVEAGVPFPHNRYGEYVGYKTDHDPRNRATSVGPYTSKKMTECLEASVARKGIRVFDNMQVIRVLSDGKRAIGLLCLDTSKPKEDVFALFNCKNIIFATGGPAGMYRDSVYPHGHYGANGLAFEAGVTGKNLTEWQYGLASLHPRWNVSGTYMQALPRFISTDADGRDEREFLLDYFTDVGNLLTKVFLKGYQWPFDVRKMAEGSSIIDVLVYLETEKGRKVYLDFSRNPCGGDIDYTALSDEAHTYLEHAWACFGTPIERLAYMNAPAVAFYRDKGVDLTYELLEIALCAQHNNGGLGINCWWQTNVEGFFAAGEAAASHGVYRPGGSALNAGQVGSTRAAQYIAARRGGDPLSMSDFLASANRQVEDILSMARVLRSARPQNEPQEQSQNPDSAWEAITSEMSRAGGAFRDAESIQEVLENTRKLLVQFPAGYRTDAGDSLSTAFRLRDILICQDVYLSAMQQYIASGGKSRGSALYTDTNGTKPFAALPDRFTFTLDNGERGDEVQEVTREAEKNTFVWRKVRPLPVEDDTFENVWRDYRKNGSITE